MPLTPNKEIIDEILEVRKTLSPDLQQHAIDRCDQLIIAVQKTSLSYDYVMGALNELKQVPLVEKTKYTEKDFKNHVIGDMQSIINRNIG